MGKNQSASNLTNIIKQDANGNISFVSGSTTLMSVSSSGAIATTGNVAGTASYASNAELLDGLDSTVFTLTSSFAAQTASFTAFTASQNILNGKYATTGSNTFTGIQTVNSNLIVTGSITAQTLVVQTITSSVDFVTGSTRFGSILGNTHVFSGSVTMNPGGLFVSSSGLVGIGNIVPAYNLDVTGTGRFTGDFYLTGTDAKIWGGTSAGRLILANSTSTTYGIFYGATNATPNVTTFVNNAALTLTLNANNTATFASSVQVGSTLGHSLSLGLAAPTTDTLNHIFAGQGVIAGQAAGGETDIGNNWYYYSGWKYRLTNAASNIKLNGDVISFERATSGTANAAITFVESMRITSAGKVGIGTTSPNFDVTIGTNANQKVLAVGCIHLVDAYIDQGVWGCRIQGTDNGIDGTNMQFITRASASGGFSTRMTITTGGNIGAPSGTNIYNASDRRLKRNVTPLSNALNKILNLNPVMFNWIQGYEPTEEDKDMLGFIAQDVQNVVPEAVESFAGGGALKVGDLEITNPLRVNEKFIIPVLVKAIQELKAENDILKERLTAGGL